MAVSTTHLGLVDEGDALISLPIEGTDPGTYLPADARIVLFGNDLPSFIPNLQSGLVAGGATLASGRPVETSVDVITWCLEQLQAAVA
jgi:hypothetical protein